MVRILFNNVFSKFQSIMLKNCQGEFLFSSMDDFCCTCMFVVWTVSYSGKNQAKVRSCIKLFRNLIRRSHASITITTPLTTDLMFNLFSIPMYI